MGALAAANVSFGLTAGAVASKGTVATCDCIGMVGDAGAGAEAVCSRGLTAEFISGVDSTGKTDGETSSL